MTDGPGDPADMRCEIDLEGRNGSLTCERGAKRPRTASTCLGFSSSLLALDEVSRPGRAGTRPS